VQPWPSMGPSTGLSVGLSEPVADEYEGSDDDPESQWKKVK
jgi:hypothetical protein